MKASSMNPKEELKAIREIMERSSKFLSLSGLAGIFAGICALIGAAVAYFIIQDSGHILNNEYLQSLGNSPANNFGLYLAIDALLVLVIASIGAIYFSYRKAKIGGQAFWSASSKRLVGHLMIPLAAGGIFAMIMIMRNNLDLVASVTLIFYGLALVNAGKFTFGEIHYLGLTEIVLGIMAGIFINHGLLFWAIGFGVMHIVYGIVMYDRYER
jgi:hypothetical protein